MARVVPEKKWGIPRERNAGSRIEGPSINGSCQEEIGGGGGISVKDSTSVRYWVLDKLRKLGMWYD